MERKIEKKKGKRYGDKGAEKKGGGEERKDERMRMATTVQVRRGKLL